MSDAEGHRSATEALQHGYFRNDFRNRNGAWRLCPSRRENPCPNSAD